MQSVLIFFLFFIIGKKLFHCGHNMKTQEKNGPVYEHMDMTFMPPHFGGGTFRFAFVCPSVPMCSPKRVLKEFELDSTNFTGLLIISSCAPMV
jgi:hypothetical protein